MVGQRGQQGLLDRELGHVGVVQPRRGKEKKERKKEISEKSVKPQRKEEKRHHWAHSWGGDWNYEAQITRTRRKVKCEEGEMKTNQWGGEWNFEEKGFCDKKDRNGKFDRR